MSEEQDRRQEDVPSAYKLYFQKMLNQLEPSPKFLEAFETIISKNNLALIDKMSHLIDKAIHCQEQSNERRFREIELDIDKLSTKHQVEVARLHAVANTLMWVFGIGAVLIAGSFTLATVFR